MVGISESAEKMPPANGDRLAAARHLVPGRPPHTEYTLTPRGARLAQAVAGLLQH